MNSTKKSINIKSRIVSLIALVALILCTILSFGVIHPHSVVSAEDDPQTAAVRDERGIRFVQVAAGEDFAIGLTYDRKLYGWSLKSRRDEANPATLGDYYTEYPTEINVVFRYGPARRASLAWSNNSGDNNYHEIRYDDKIASIAATRTTAAFVTEKGFIYTWGKDNQDVTHINDKNYLLMRAVDDNQEYTWKVPYIIDYHYYGPKTNLDDVSNASQLSAVELLIPTGTERYTSLAAGEYNYIFLFERNFGSGNLGLAPGTYFHTFVWGSMLYNATNGLPDGTAQNYSSISVNAAEESNRRVFQTRIASRTSGNLTTGVTAVAGGYTVGINNVNNTVEGGTSLQLHGRNFLTSQALKKSADGEYVYNVENTTELITSDDKPAVEDISFTQGNEYTIKSAIAGGNGGATEQNGIVGLDAEQYYARQKTVEDLNAPYRVDDAAFIIDSKRAGNQNANRISTYTYTYKNSEGRDVTEEVTAAKPIRYAVALGNDIGYGISGNKLFGWGDNVNNQLTSAVGTKFSRSPAQILSSAGNIVSVAAGKQVSKANKAFYGTTTTLSVGDSVTFVPAVQNDDKFISGALTESGVIYAWCKDIGPEKITFADIAENDARKENFAAVYSGYGENLFAVTVSGKLVRISVTGDGTDESPRKFKQDIYDIFYNKQNKRIDNWEVNNSNEIVFNVPEVSADAPVDDRYAPALGNATFYVWSAVGTNKNAENADVEAENILFNGGSKTDYYRLVTSNNIGDAYRIVGFSAADANIEYIKAEKLNDKDDADDYYAPVFKFDGNPMTDTQRENMFDFSVVYDSEGNGVGISISPKKSSKGKKITLEFYIARYNSYDFYSNTTDKAIYYDHKKCTITFSIADTASVIQYSAFDAANNNKSSLPLLDPNNRYNKYYSLAVHNVSGGVDELIKYLTTRNNTVNETFKADILTEMRKDLGFPDSGKIENGNLGYYLNAKDVANFNDTYQYLFKDRDGDRIRIDTPTAGNIITGDGVVGTIENITIKVKLLSAYGLNSEFGDKTDAQITKLISTDFDNMYGLYNISCTTENHERYLSFTYDVVRLEAKGSTGTIGYESNQNKYDVKGYRTISSSGGARVSVAARTIVNYDYNAGSGYVENTRGDKAIPGTSSIARVFSLPTVRLRPDLISPDEPINVYGSADGGRNTYTETRTSAVYVGETVEINLSRYLTELDSTVISFSYKNSASSESLKSFGNLFTDYTGHNMPIVSVSGTKINVHPTTMSPIDFTIEVQRFVNAEKTQYFTNTSDKVDEVIKLRFKFYNIVGFDMRKNNQAMTEFLITQTSTIDLFGNNNDENLLNRDKSFVNLVSTQGGNVSERALPALLENAKIYGISSSEDKESDSEKIFTWNSNPETSKTSFTVSPNRSGTGTIQFSANIYDKSLRFEITINVSKETTLKETVTIIDDYYLYVSALDGALLDANSFNADVVEGKYRILYGDVKDSSVSALDREYNAIYFTDGKNNRVSNKNGVPFIRNAVFEHVNDEKPNIRIIASNSTTQQKETYYMHVRYTSDNVKDYDSANPNSIIEIIVPVESGKIKLPDPVAGGDLTAKIDCRHTPKPTDWWKTEGKGLDTRVTIDLSYLLESIATESPAQYKIFLVSADDKAASYFSYSASDDKRTIVISPKANTPKAYELNVSVYKDDGSADETVQVLSFDVSVDGIITKLPVMTEDGVMGYGNIWLYSFIIVFGVLAIIFIIRFIVYMRRRAKQRAIIKRNQDLIRMRDRMHGKASSATREQLVRSKLKMDDPKYAKMFNDMRREKEDESGITLDNSDLAAAAERKSKKKKKKGGKKSVAELKAELEAKKAAFAAAQAQNAQPVNPFVNEVPIDGSGFGAPDGGFGGDAGGFASPDGGFASPDGGFGAQDIDGSEIIFDASDIGDGNI